MTSRWRAAALALTLLVLGSLHVAPHLTARPPDVLQWIWFDEGDPARDAPAQTRFFRKSFDHNRTVDEAILDITADDEFTVWFNGTLVGKGDDWKRVYSFDVKKHFRLGRNVLAVEARNRFGPAGLLVRLGYVPNGLTREVLTSNATWKAAREAPSGWQKSDYDDSRWAS